LALAYLAGLIDMKGSFPWLAFTEWDVALGRLYRFAVWPELARDGPLVAENLKAPPLFFCVAWCFAAKVGLTAKTPTSSTISAIRVEKAIFVRFFCTQIS